MLELLRGGTRQAHAALEGSLDLLAEPLERARFVAALQGFHAFHLAWEPLGRRLIGDEALLAGRGRLALVEADLAALRAPPDPGPPFRLDALATPSAAWGALYVVEGSSLGGQLISRALEGAPWLPAGGLSYFSPYGRRTGAMWRAFQTALERAAPALDAVSCVEGARWTFEALRLRLAPPP